MRGRNLAQDKFAARWGQHGLPFEIFISVFVITPEMAAQGTNREAMAGWAEVEITPPLGIGLGGRGGPETLAKNILDRLYAQVLYMKDSKGTGFVLVSFDLVSLPHDLSDQIRNAIVNELGVEWNLV